MDKQCANHLAGAKHDKEGFVNLTRKIQYMIDNKFITLEVVSPHVNLNRLPNHVGETINMIEIDED